MLETRYAKTSGLAGFRAESPRETVIVMPALDMDLARKAATVMAARANAEGLLVVVEDDLRLGFVMTANLVYAKTSSAYFAYTAQDAFAGYSWLEYGLDTLRKTGGGLLAFNEGLFFGKVAAFGLADRRWLRGVYGNFLFHPEYAAHFADMELSVIALETDMMSFNPYALLVEADYDKHNGIAEGGRAAYRKDYETYVSRAGRGFDGRVAPFTPEPPEVALDLPRPAAG